MFSTKLKAQIHISQSWETSESHLKDKRVDRTRWITKGDSECQMPGRRMRSLSFGIKFSPASCSLRKNAMTQATRKNACANLISIHPLHVHDSCVCIAVPFCHTATYSDTRAACSFKPCGCILVGKWRQFWGLKGPRVPQKLQI